MTSENILYLIVSILVFEFLLERILYFLNSRNFKKNLCTQAKEIYNESEYRKSMNYEREKYYFGEVQATFNFLIVISLILSGMFGKFYLFLQNYFSSQIVLSVIFFISVFLIYSIINLPFSYYSTFSIEEKFDFNKSSKKIFFMDFFKNTILVAIFIFLILSPIVYFYIYNAKFFVIFSWILVSLFSIFMIMFYSSLIVPIFNKQEKLEKGELRDAIGSLSKKLGFKIENVFIIDGSKRNSKANAYFSGLGPKKRIVLYDTLIKDLNIDEIISVLAHEIGHYKKKHTLIMLIFSLLQTAIMFYILSIFLGDEIFSIALGGLNGNFALSCLSFIIIFTPISMFLGILGNILSRKHEFEADRYAKENFSGDLLKSSLIKLAKNNLTNIYPNKIYEFFYYSHPNILKRLKKL